jgi:ATP-binding cassette subfamily C protein
MVESVFSLSEFGLLVNRLRTWSRVNLSQSVWLSLLAALADVIGLIALVPLVTLVLGGRVAGIAQKFFDLLGWIGIHSDHARLASAMAFFLVVMLGRSYAVAVRDRANISLQSGYTAHVQISVMERLARAPWQEVAALQHARITQALGADVARAGTSAQLALQIFGAALIFVLQWLLALAIAPVIALIAFAIGALAALAFTRSLITTGSVGAAINRRGLSLAHLAQQFLSGLKLAKAQNAEANFTADFARVTQEMLDLRNGYQFRQIRMRQALTFAAAASAALFLLAGKWSGMDAARLLASFAVLTRISAAGTTLVQLFQQLATILPAHTTLMALTDELGSYADAVRATGNGVAPLPEPSDAGELIRLEQVGYSVGPTPRVRDVSLSIGQGEVVALTGDSGAGKTTLLDLITGLLTPTSGAIFVHGELLSGNSGKAWRDRIAYVTQDTWLMNDTIRANLSWGGGGSIAEDKLWWALAIAGADELVRQTDDGLDTTVNERGLRFSGGERQRLALARAILREPKVLILDEATNAMDPEAERAVFERLFAALPSVSLLVIAHRPSTIEICRRLIYMHKGAIVADRRI